MIKLKIYVNIKNKNEKDNGFQTTIEGGLRPCEELLDFTKEFIKKNLKQDILDLQEEK